MGLSILGVLHWINITSDITRSPAPAALAVPRMRRLERVHLFVSGREDGISSATAYVSFVGPRLQSHCPRYGFSLPRIRINTAVRVIDAVGRKRRGPRTRSRAMSIYCHSPTYRPACVKICIGSRVSLSSTICLLTTYPRLQSFTTMWLRARKIPLASQRFLITAPRRPLGTTRPPTETAGQSTHPIPWGPRAPPKDGKLIWAAGGIGVATIALLWAKPTGDRFPDDPRDLRALSRVPLGKLCSGWM